MQVQLIHFIQHGRILQQGDLVFFHDLADPVDVGLCLVVFDFQVIQTVGAFLEDAQKSLLFFLLKTPQLRHHARQHLADLTHVLCAHIVQGVLGKCGDLFLASRTVLQHQLSVGDINLGGKIIYHFLFFRRQYHIRHPGFFLLCLRHCP